LVDVVGSGTVEDGCRDRARVAAVDDLPAVAPVDAVRLAVLLAVLGEDAVRGRPAEVRLEHLSDVHPARHAERVEDDVDRPAVLSVSPFGVTLPTSRSPAPTSAPIRTTPRSSSCDSDSSERFGMSRVISSSPSFVERASISYSWMWIDVRMSSLTIRSEMTIASSKLKPSN